MRRDGNPTGNRTHISYPDYTYYIHKMMKALEGHLDETDRPIDARQIYDALIRHNNARDKLIAELTRTLEQHVNLLVADWKEYGELSISDAKPPTDIIRITYFFSDIMSLARRRERKVTPAVELERPDEKTANPWYVVGGLPTLTSGIDGPRPCSGNSAKQKRRHVHKLLEDLDRLTFDDHTTSEDLIADLKAQNALPPSYQSPDIRPLDRDELSEAARRAAQQRKRGTSTNTTTRKVQAPLRTTPGALVLDYVAVPPLRKNWLVQKPPSPSPSALSEDDASPRLPSWTTINEDLGFIRRPRASPTPPVGDGSHWLVDIHGNMRPENERGTPPNRPTPPASSAIGDAPTPSLPAPSPAGRAPSPVVDAPSPTGRVPSPIVDAPAASLNAPPPTARASSPVLPSPGATSPTGLAPDVNLPAESMHVDDVGHESNSASSAVDTMQVDSVPTDGNHVGPVPSTSAMIAPATASVAEVDDDPPMFGPLTEDHWIGVQQGRLLAPWDPIPAFDDVSDGGM